MRTARLIPFVLAVAAVLGCPNEAATPPTKPGPMPTVPPGDYFPLVKGSSWKYEVVTQGALIQGTLTYTVTKVASSGGETKAEGLRELNLTYSGKDRYAATAIVYWRKAKDGVYEKVDGEGDEEQILALPLKYGTDWTYGTSQMAIAAVETAEINGKSYKGALRVRTNQDDKPGAAYFVKDVGMVSWSGRNLAVGCDRQIGLGLLAHVKKDAPVPTPAPSATPPACSAVTPGPSTDPATPTPFPVRDVSPTPSAAPSATPSAVAT